MSIYLDNSATSLSKPDCVAEAMTRFMREVGASPGRSAHAPGIEASRVIAGARRAVAQLLGVKNPSRLLFAPNCTEALNLAIRGLVRPKTSVVTTKIEHNSVMRPLSALIEAGGISIITAEADETGVTMPGELRRLLREDTSLIIMSHASNVTGAIQPIEEWGLIARAMRIPFLVDAAQTAGCLPIDFDQLPVDLMAFSGHKGLLGPQGTGGLALREGVLPEPLVTGGTGSASSEISQPAMLPDRYESGTPNTPGLAGLGAAAGFLLETGVERIREGCARVGGTALAGLSQIPGIRLYGPRSMEANIGTFSFTMDGADPAETAALLEERYGILTRVGLHCSPCAHETLGTLPHGTVRASMGWSTKERDVSALIQALRELCGE